MLNLGLTAAEQRAFEAALADHHSLRVDVDVLSLDGDHLSRLDPATIDGQVNVDATGAVTRSLTLTVFDPARALNFDSNSPDDGALYLDRMIRATYAVKAPVTGWVEVPVFTGPVTSLNRSSDLLNIECQGKESLASTAVWLPLSLKKGHLKTNAIRTILAERAGESRFDIPDLAPRLPHTLSLGRQSVAWVEAQKLAESMGRQLFYDGRGVCRLRNLPGNVFTFRTGDGGTITGAPQVSYSTEDVRNVVWVKGGKPRGSKTDSDPSTSAPRHVADVQATAVAPRDHTLSPWRLGRNGVPRYLVEFVDNTHIRSRTEARRVANQRLDDLLEEAVSVTLESFPVPHLEELDRVRVATDEAVFTMRLRQFSLPLKVGSSMSVGFNQRVSVRRGKVRR